MLFAKFLLAYSVVDFVNEITFICRKFVTRISQTQTIALYYDSDSNLGDRKLFLDKYLKSFHLSEYGNNRENNKKAVIFAFTANSNIKQEYKGVLPQSDIHTHIDFIGNKYNYNSPINSNSFFSASLINEDSYWVSRDLLEKYLQNYSENNFENFIYKLTHFPNDQQFLFYDLNNKFLYEDNLFSLKRNISNSDIKGFLYERVNNFFAYLDVIQELFPQYSNEIENLNKELILSQITNEHLLSIKKYLPFFYLENKFYEEAYQFIEMQDNLQELDNGFSLMHYSISNITILELLFAKNISVNPVISDNGIMPVMIAAKSGNYEAISLLLDHGSHINIRNIDNISPLSIACAKQDNKIVELLVEHGAYRFDTWPHWQSCVSVSAEHCNLNIIKSIFSINHNSKIDVSYIDHQYQGNNDKLPFQFYIMKKNFGLYFLDVHINIESFNYESFIDDMAHIYCSGGISFQPNIMYCPFAF